MKLFLITIYLFLSRLSRYYHVLKTRFWYSLFFKESGTNNCIRNPILITPRNIILGCGVSIRDGARIECIEVYRQKYFNPVITIGDNVSIEQNVHMTCANSIIIGKNTAIAANVTITDINHPYENPHIPPEQHDISVKAVEIGEDCKIYNNVVILPGTIIGRHCIIGANSVVNREIPDFSVAVGAPVRIVKRYNLEQNHWIRK